MGSLMDTLHSQVPDLGGGASFEDDEPAYGPGTVVAVSAKDERRLQVRAYNFWASLLGDRQLPSIDDLETSGLPDFAPKGVLLDFTGGPDNPVIAFLGADLAEESGAPGPIRNLADVPEGTLLSRITTHHMQILDNQAPVGFEDEFVDRHGATMVYRGILLPFCGNADRIEYVCGVINWKQVEAGRSSVRADSAPLHAARIEPMPITEWADGPLDFDPGPDDPVLSGELPVEALRALPTRSLGTVSHEGVEFALLLTRRLPSGEIVVLGEFGEDHPLVERAARQLLA